MERSSERQSNLALGLSLFAATIALVLVLVAIARSDVNVMWLACASGAFAAFVSIDSSRGRRDRERRAEQRANDLMITGMIAHQGQAEEFDRYISWHYPRLYSLSLRIVGNRREASRIATATLFEAWQRVDLHQGPVSKSIEDPAFVARLYSIAVRIALDFVRLSSRTNSQVELKWDSDTESVGFDYAEELEKTRFRLKQGETEEIATVWQEQYISA